MELEKFLVSGEFVDSDHPAVEAYAHEKIGNATGTLDKILNLYYSIRDEIRYEPYMEFTKKRSYRASDAVIDKVGWCVPKAALLAACCRIHAIPARPGYADVKNHLATDRLLELLGTDLFAWHSYCEILIDETWVKSTPSFNLSLCEKFGLKPLDFDGKSDSLFHEFDILGNRHMEYIHDRGTFPDVPFEMILKTFREIYRKEYIEGAGGNFFKEADQQN